MSDIIFNFKSMIIGHRGVKGKIMENTLESILYAIDLGVDGIEIDIRRCYTGEIILFHDETLDRLAFKDDFYFDKTINKQIRKLQWYHLYNTDLIDSLGRKYKIPKLIDILRHPKIYNSDVLISINVRDTISHEDLVTILTDVIDEGLYETSRFMLSSSNYETLKYLKEYIDESSNEDEKYQKMKIGLIFSGEAIHEKDLDISVKMCSKVVTHLILESLYLMELVKLVELIKKYRLNVFVYFNDNLSNFDLKNTVDGIITDNPNIFK